MKHPPPWRTGGHPVDEPGPRQKTLYDATGELVGCMQTTEAAHQVVAAVNARVDVPPPLLQPPAPEPMHVWVTLRTRDGGFVARAQVPAFQAPAEVLVWGDRFFQLAPMVAAHEEDIPVELQYREVMAFFVVQPVELTEP